MILYDYILSPECYTARLMASLLGKPLETVAVDFHPGAEQRGAAFRRINPAGTIPVLVDEALILTEPAAILTHLAGDAPEWLGRGAVGQEWISRAGHFAASLGGARLHEMLSQPGDLATMQADGVMWLRILEATLTEARISGHAFLTGEKPTIADILIFPHVALAPDGGISLDDYPSIRLWMRAIRSLPGFVEMPGIHRLHDLSPEPGHEVGGAAAC
ncbi:glutathione S-transferase family protein [Paracoccus sp. MBLB3053]|uniref:Glutathione S-transferase family protein n=1 Tax=Paracoccus aurantius TaxID=3073814 RepID=A0ABU2HS26_9RHOB|nr:glutathione S-transferase family protein [Paracoccus sp. MBLB3053]MDS9467864.1 glutathione S-transferase family protein [Paracoccus sp. MBLB3053]